LEEKRQYHANALREIEDGLARFDRLVSLATGEAEEPIMRSREVRAPEARAAKEVVTPPREEGYSEMFLEAALGKTDPFDVRLKDEVNAKHGLSLDDKQASNALRNLLKRGKIKLIRAGGPRKPALYANLDHPDPAWHVAPNPASDLSAAELLSQETEEP
jgi:hypothetical protein